MTDKAKSAMLPAEGQTLEDQAWYQRARTLEIGPSDTIVPPKHTPDAGGIRAVGALSSFASEQRAGAAIAVDLGKTLGEGGMGIVRAGVQRALGRPVAVKTLKPDIDGEWATLKMLREAWVTGSLEHPNVVPIYDVGVDPEGRPFIVLKKIDGQDWFALMGDADAVNEAFGTRDLLEWNLAVLEQVCNAVRFAHSRSILHRDLKPENVMIGEFGEVYLVDWGIAVSTTDDGSGRLPLASKATEMAGTPYYMAPEMLGGGAARLSERTDVYLLGAILYEIVCGAPPHQGSSLLAVIASAALSSPKVPEDVPEELRQTILRAMARAPEERFESAEAFRLALVEFLEHRGSARLAHEAHHRLDELKSAIEQAAPGDADARDQLYLLFNECRFGFRSSLDAWPDNPEAQAGARRSIEAMVSYELDEDDPRAAATLAATLPEVPGDLAARIADARATKSARDQRLLSFAAIGRDEDRDIGRRTRAFLAATITISWILVPLLSLVIEGDGNSWPLTFVWNSAMFGFLVLAGYWARNSMTKTAFNRRVGSAVLLGIGGTLPLHLGNWLLGISAIHSQVMGMAIWSAVATYSVVAIDRRLLPNAIGTTSAFLLACVYPQHRWILVSLLSMVSLANVTWIWRIQREDFDAARERITKRSRAVDQASGDAV